MSSTIATWTLATTITIKLKRPSCSPCNKFPSEYFVDTEIGAVDLQLVAGEREQSKCSHSPTFFDSAASIVSDDDFVEI
jgi:hypothetical protein